MTSGYYDRNGKLMTFQEWASKIGETQYCMVAASMVTPQFRDLDCIPNNETGVCIISTVWLGLDAGYGSDFTIFQSKCVGGTEETNGMIWTYATEEEASTGHKAMVENVLTAIREKLGEEAGKEVERVS